MKIVLFKNKRCKSINCYVVNKIVFTFEIMKNLFLILFGVLLSFMLCSSSCNNQSKDAELGEFLTEEAIFNEVKKEYQGITKNDVCIDQVKAFKTLFILGFFAHDRGCGDNRYFYKGNEIQLNDENIQLILIDNGFKVDQLKTVQTFHTDVINHSNSVLTSVPTNFDTASYEFHAPKTWEENGQIISSVWIQRPGGMIPEDNFYLSVYVVNKKGIQISHSKQNKFTVPFN